MSDRKVRTIRQEHFDGAGVFQFDIETQQFGALLVTWSSSDSATAAPTNLVFCPTIMRRPDGSALNNFPTPAALVMPVAGSTVYLGFGLHSMIGIPLPAMMTFGVVGAAGSQVSIRVEGEEVDSLLESPVPLERARS